MRKLITAAAILCFSIGFASLHHAKTISNYKGPPLYVLRAWRIDGGEPDQYLWSLDERPFEGGRFPDLSPSTLYRSLDSPTLRTRVAGLPAGARVWMQWNLGGALKGDQSSYVDRIRGLERLQDFAAFCKSKNLTFAYGGVGN